MLGPLDGTTLGWDDGVILGNKLGFELGFMLGPLDGTTLGWPDGATVGL